MGKVNSEQRHYFFIAGAMFKLTETVGFKPTTFVKVTQNAPVEADLTGLLYFYDKVWAGLMVRTGDAVGVLIGLNVTDQLSAGDVTYLRTGQGWL